MWTIVKDNYIHKETFDISCHLIPHSALDLAIGAEKEDFPFNLKNFQALDWKNRMANIKDYLKNFLL